MQKPSECLRQEEVKDEGWRDGGIEGRGREGRREGRRKGWRKKRRERTGGKTKPQAVDDIKKVPSSSVPSIETATREPTSPGWYKAHTVKCKGPSRQEALFPFIRSFEHLLCADTVSHTG